MPLFVLDPIDPIDWTRNKLGDIEKPRWFWMLGSDPFYFTILYFKRGFCPLILFRHTNRRWFWISPVLRNPRSTKGLSGHESTFEVAVVTSSFGTRRRGELWLELPTPCLSCHDVRWWLQIKPILHPIRSNAEKNPSGLKSVGEQIWAEFICELGVETIGIKTYIRINKTESDLTAKHHI